jgi:prepilin-type N-terminal cleavage/methylation domain-containing protein
MHATNHPAASASVPAAGQARRDREPVACQGKSRRRLAAGFTLVEMLAVIVIIAILASALVSSLNKAKSLARQADCKSNMRQLGAAILIYRSDNGGQNPAWLSCLYPNYVDDLHLFICRSDPNHGTGNCYPDSPSLPALGSWTSSALVNDNSGNHDTQRNNGNGSSQTGVNACSYFYEFSVAPSPWQSLTYSQTKPAGLSALGNFTLYRDFKNAQLQYGDDADGCVSYSTSRLPIIRCYQHINEGQIRGHVTAKSGLAIDSPIQSFPITINVAHAGNVYVGPPWWEGALQPGEQ